MTQTEENWEAVMKLFETGLSVSDIVEKTGVSRTSVYRWSKGQIPSNIRIEKEIKDLNALGWSRDDIGARVGVSQKVVRRFLGLVNKTKEGIRQPGDLINERIIFCYEGRNKNNAHVYLYQCSCGTLAGPSTIGHIKQNPRCRICHRGKNSGTWEGIGDIPGNHLTRIKTGAEKRNLEYNIDGEYLWQLFLNQKEKCYYSDIKIYFNTYDQETTASLDRIDSNKGYIKGNVVWTHKIINRMKSDFTVTEFHYFCREVANHFDKKNI